MPNEAREIDLSKQTVTSKCESSHISRISLKSRRQFLMPLNTKSFREISSEHPKAEIQ